MLDLGFCTLLKAEEEVSPQCSAYIRSYFPCLKARNGMKQVLSPHCITATMYNEENAWHASSITMWVEQVGELWLSVCGGSKGDLKGHTGLSPVLKSF